MVARLGGDNVTGDDELEGNEESMSSYAEVVAIDQIHNAVRLTGQLDNRRSCTIKSAKLKRTCACRMKSSSPARFS
ncbi:MAG: DUF4043 family protein [Elusimicrobia bacterium]|nr:DUF4043 family protein [Elusimicrobiota bacterium]